MPNTTHVAVSQRSLSPSANGRSFGPSVAPAHSNGLAGHAPLTLRARAARAVVASSSAGIVAVPGAAIGAGSIRDSRAAMAILTPPAQRAISKFAQLGWGWAPVVRGTGTWLGATATRAWPASAYGWRWPEKVADAGAAALGLVADKVPYASEHGLLVRLPGAPYPAECMEGPLPGCADLLGYQRSAMVAPYLYACNAVIVSACLGALLGVVALTCAPNAVAKLAQPEWIELPNAWATWAARKMAKSIGQAAGIFIEEQRRVHEQNDAELAETASLSLANETDAPSAVPADERMPLLVPICAAKAPRTNDRGA